jgi:sugar transferase (PEP-CTERM/EpsH1 system associated)
LKILYLAHRIPFPPNKGDKIRSFHEIKYFSRRHELHLLAFFENPEEACYAEDLRKFCKSVTLVPLHRRLQHARALMAMLSCRPWTLGYFSSPQMRAAVRKQLISFRFDAIFVYSSSMAPYVSAERGIPKVLDFVDSDALKWLQYAHFKSGPARWLYSWEGRILLRFEKKMADAFDDSTFVSSREAGHLCSRKYEGKVHFVQNGIDLEALADIKIDGASKTIIFTGVMDYFPNVDAVAYFAREIFPLVRAAVPEARFLIVGRNPTPEVQRLVNLPGVQVTGTVPDVRPFLAESKVAVVPVRISRGIQNKILEALAAGLPVVTTSAAAEGLASINEYAIAVAEEPKAYAEHVIAYLKVPPNAGRVAATRRRLIREYNWERNLSAFDEMLAARMGAVASSYTAPGKCKTD